MKRLWVYFLALMGVLSLGACQQKTTIVSAAPAPAAAPVGISTDAATNAQAGYARGLTNGFVGPSITNGLAGLTHSNSSHQPQAAEIRREEYGNSIARCDRP